MDILSFQTIVSLFTLTALEIVLGIDNIIFIALIAGKLPPKNREITRRVGLLLALVLRIILLTTLGWLMGMTKPLFAIANHGFTLKDCILIAGGIFLLIKSTIEIHHRVGRLEEGDHESKKRKDANNFWQAIAQIVMIDLVFSIDSIVTAIGMVADVNIMIAAVIIAVCVMMILSKPIGDFIEENPSLKILALSFLLLIGALLVAEGFGQHIDKAYVYFAMAFSVGVEFLNLRMDKIKR
jgi:predicted tellurium resistance membrane protein TerC